MFRHLGLTRNPIGVFVPVQFGFNVTHFDVLVDTFNFLSTDRICFLHEHRNWITSSKLPQIAFRFMT